jgi:hypothetical protein
MYVYVIATVLGGRCGFALPKNSSANPCLNIAVWVPEGLLKEAAGLPSAPLMAHIRLELHKELQDPQGRTFKQFKWLDAARRAGLGGVVNNAIPVMNGMRGDITVDWLPASLYDLPVPAGMKIDSASMRFMCTFLPGYVMVMPVPKDLAITTAAVAAAEAAMVEGSDDATNAAAAVGAEGVQSSEVAQAGHDFEIEVTFATKQMPMLITQWQQLGLKQLSAEPRLKQYSLATHTTTTTTSSSGSSSSTTTTTSSSSSPKGVAVPRPAAAVALSPPASLLPEHCSYSNSSYSTAQARAIPGRAAAQNGQIKGLLKQLWRTSWVGQRLWSGQVAAAGQWAEVAGEGGWGAGGAAGAVRVTEVLKPQVVDVGESCKRSQRTTVNAVAGDL